MARTITKKGVKMIYRGTFPSQKEAIKEGNRRCINKRGLLYKFYDIRKVKNGYALYTE